LAGNLFEEGNVHFDWVGSVSLFIGLMAVFSRVRGSAAALRIGSGFTYVTFLSAHFLVYVIITSIKRLKESTVDV
jgi:hypothetical protein